MISLITGGCGFIGSHIVDRLLAEGHTVRVIDNFTTGRPANLEHQKDNKKLTITKADIRNKEEIAPIFDGVDYVFHLAALADIVPSIQKPWEYYSSNVLGTYNVVECAKDANIKKLVYSASSSCYGEIRPQYPYALTKRLGEETVLHWGQVYGLPVITLRLFNVYGTRSRTSGTYGAVFGVFLAQKLAGQPFTVVGTGEQTRDCTYADTSKIEKVLGWHAKVTLEEGVQKILDNIDYWREAPVWTPDTIGEATKDWFKYLGKE